MTPMLYKYPSIATVSRWAITMRRSPHIYTDKQLAWVEAHQVGITRKQLHSRFNAKFKTAVNFNSIVNLCSRHNLKSGITGGQFKSGDTPWNLGVTGYMGANATSFKKGQTPKNHRPVGSERITKDGYIEIKIAEPNVWQLKHIVEWQKVNGKLPKSHCIRFLDNDRANCHIDNLYCIHRGVHARVNHKNPANTDCSQLNKAIIVSEQLSYTVNNIHKIRG